MSDNQNNNQDDNAVPASEPEAPQVDRKPEQDKLKVKPEDRNAATLESEGNPAANLGAYNPNFEPDMSLVGKENKFGVMDGKEMPPQQAQWGASTAQALVSSTTQSGGGPALRQHGFSQPGNHMGAGLNYYTIYTTVDITPTGIPQYIIPRGYPPGVYTDTISNSQYMFDKLIETIGLRAQPVTISKVTSQTASAFTNAITLADFAPGSGNVWTLSFIIEHNGAWDTKQVGWMAEGHPPIKGGPTPYDTNPDLGQTIAENLMYMSPAFVNTGNSGSTTNTFTVVANGPFS